MYAIIKASGRQFRVEPGTVFFMDRLAASPGETITLTQDVLMVGDNGTVTIGKPAVEGAKVELEVMDHLRGEKLIVFKMRRRKGSRKEQGHRQELTRVRVKDIAVN